MKEGMNLYRFIHSKDIRAHLQSLSYRFTLPEAMFLVWQCADAVLVLQRAAKLIDDTAIHADAADVNGDKTIDTADAVLILQKAAKLIEKFPAEE